MTISLTFPDGAQREFPSGITGVDIAKGISPSLLKRTVAMALDGTVVDLADPIERDARIEFLNRAAERRKVGPNARVLVHRANRPIEKAVGHARGSGNFLSAHVGQLIDLLAEFRALRIDRDKIRDESIDLGFELAAVFLRDRNQSRGLRRRNDGHRIGRRQRDRAHRGGFGRGGGHRNRTFRYWAIGNMVPDASRRKLSYTRNTASRSGSTRLRPYRRTDGFDP